MKRIALLLVLANCGVFLYWRYGDLASTDAPVAPVLPTSAPAPILLVSERPPPKPQCQSLGPVANRLILTAVERWLGDRFGALSEREAMAPASPVFRVQVTTPSADLATRLAQRLKASGVNDVAVLAPDPGETAVIIALGIFSDRANADRRVIDLRRHGVDPAISTIERQTSQWWLDFSSLESPDRDALVHAVPTASAVTLAPCELAGGNDDAPAAPESSAPPDTGKGFTTPSPPPGRAGAAA